MADEEAALHILRKLLRSGGCRSRWVSITASSDSMFVLESSARLTPEEAEFVKRLHSGDIEAE